MTISEDNPTKIGARNVKEMSNARNVKRTGKRLCKCTSKTLYIKAPPLVVCSIANSMNDEKVVGGYNDAPPNFVEITEKEFAQSQFFIYEPVKREFRQIREGDQMFSIQLYWFADGSGIALRSDFWAGKIRYFKFFICEHKWKNIERRMCWTKDVCILCGYVSEIDSSD